MKLGKDFILEIVNDDSGAFEPLAFAQSCSYDINNTLVKVSSPNTGGYEHYRKKTTGWVMQHEGLIGNPTMRYTFKGQQYDFISLISRVVRSGEPLTCRWHEDDEIKQGQAIVKSYKEVASEKALAKVSIALQGTGELKDLDPNDLEGNFVWVRHTDDHDVPHLTLYAIGRTIADFTVVVRTDYHGGQDVVVGKWEALGSRTQTFNCPQNTILSVRAVRITADEQTIEQPRVIFSDATTLHVVLLQTDTRDEQQQLHRFVQPLWWGGYALGDMEVKNTGNVTILTLPTTGANGSIDPVEIDPSINILSPGELHIDMTGDAGQTAHCCDRTASLEKTLAYYQTSNNTPGVDPYMIVGPGKEFRCNFDMWGNDNEGNELFRFSQATLVPIANVASPVPAVANLHFQLQGLGVDDGGPWNVTNVLTSLLEPYDLYYAYNATTQKLTLYSPNVSERLIQGVLLDGGTSGAGSIDHFYDLDSEGNRVPVTFSNIPSFATIAPMFGNGTTHDVSAISMFNLSNTISIDKLPLYDIILTGEGGVQVGTLPALSSPDRTYPTYELVDVPGSVITGAEMASDAAQTVTLVSYPQSIVVSTSVKQTGTGVYRVEAYLSRNSGGGTGSNATHPADITIQWPGNQQTVTIPAGQSSVTVQDFARNEAWMTPIVTSESWAADVFNILVPPTVDVTPTNWRLDYLGAINNYNLYDISYTQSVSGKTVQLISGDFVTSDESVTLDDNHPMANNLLRTNRSPGDFAFYVRVYSSGGKAFQVNATNDNVHSDNPVRLMYVEKTITSTAGTTSPTTVLTNVFNGIVSRHTNIGAVLPYIRVAGVYGYQGMPIYRPVSLLRLVPLGADVLEETAYPGWKDYSNATVQFVNSEAADDTNVISVGTGLTGLIVYDPAGYPMTMA